MSNPQNDSNTATPQTFGRFRILRPLSTGGMAQLYVAEESRSGKQVVLKQILPHLAANPEFVRLFVHEGRLGQRLDHLNVVQTLEAGQVGDVPYIALEYLQGRTAIQLLKAAVERREKLPLGVAIRIVADSARGLHHAHTATEPGGKPLSVVHRDVSPHNLFVCDDGVTKVLDFGIAKAASQLHQTRTGTIKGKFAYLAPEQIKGDAIDRRVDVFALGIVLFELVTLRPLFRGKSDAEMLQKVLTMDVPAPEIIRPGLSPGIAAVVLRALQRDPQRRLPSAAALADAIEAVAEAEGIDTSRALVADTLSRMFPVEHDPTPGRVVPPKLPPVVPGASQRSPAWTSEAAARESVAGGVEPAAGSRDDDAPLIEIIAAPTEPTPLHKTLTPGSVSSLLQLPADGVLSAPKSGRGWMGPAIGAAALAAVAVIAPLRHAPTESHAATNDPAATSAHATATEQVATTALAAHAVPLAARVPVPMTLREGAAAANVADTTPRDVDPVPSAVPRAPEVASAAPRVGAVAKTEGQLHITTDLNANYVVDGKTAKAKDGVLRLSPGAHKVVVSSSGLAQARTIEVTIAAGEQVTRAVHSGEGQLRLAVNPWADVSVDGKKMGITPIRTLTLREGSHTVTLTNSELGVNVKRTIVVRPDDEALLKVNLFTPNK